MEDNISKISQLEIKLNESLKTIEKLYSQINEFSKGGVYRGNDESLEKINSLKIELHEKDRIIEGLNHRLNSLLKLKKKSFLTNMRIQSIRTEFKNELDIIKGEYKNELRLIKLGHLETLWIAISKKN